MTYVVILYNILYHVALHHMQSPSVSHIKWGCYLHLGDMGMRLHLLKRDGDATSTFFNLIGMQSCSLDGFGHIIVYYVISHGMLTYTVLCFHVQQLMLLLFTGVGCTPSCSSDCNPALHK